MMHHEESPQEKHDHGMGRMAGAIGFVLLATAPLTWMITGTFGIMMIAKLVLGMGCLIYDVLKNPSAMGRMLGGRSATLMAMSTVSVLLVLGLVVVGNVLAFKNPVEWDFTKEQIHTLSPQTVQILSRLKEEVNVQAFYPPHGDEDSTTVEEILKRYQKHSALFKYELVDPYDRPDLMKQYQITDGGPRIVITTAGGREARVKGPWEDELTQGLLKVTEQSSKTVYFLTGHGESSTEDENEKTGLKGFADAIHADGYEVGALSLTEAESAPTKSPIHVNDNAVNDPIVLQVPDHVQILVVSTGDRELLPAEVAALESYLTRGGRLMLLLEPHKNKAMKSLLDRFQIEAVDDVVVDTNPVTRLLGLGAMSPLAVPEEPRHSITRDLGAGVVFSGVRSLKILKDEATTTESLLVSGASAWGETILKNGVAEFGPGDREGPIALAAVATRAVADDVQGPLNKQARFLVFGDGDWINNQYLSMQGNADMALNAVNWLLEDEDRISIRPKRREASQVFLSEGQLRQITFFAMDLLPMMIVALGLALVMNRRQR